MSSSVQMKTAAQKGREFLKVTRSQNTCKHGSMCEVHRCPRRAGRGPSHSTPCLCGKLQALSTAKGVVQEPQQAGWSAPQPHKRGTTVYILCVRETGWGGARHGGRHSRAEPLLPPSAPLSWYLQLFAALSTVGSHRRRWGAASESSWFPARVSLSSWSSPPKDWQ